MSLRTVTMAMLLAGALWAPAASAQSSPGDGPGGPIAVVTDSSNPFGHYYAEILRAEGLNEFDVTDTQDLAATLASHQVVLLATTSVNATQATQLTTWVTNGGNLIAMRPNQSLATLLGLGADAGDLTNGYIGVATSSPPGAGITADTMQFHGTADRRPVTTATKVATLYDDADSATSAAAVTLRSVGTAGGQAAAFTYDLARSVVYTRQGNPDAAGLELDGREDVIRSDDLFFPNWLDFDKVAIPQADEQQRLLANLITQMTVDRGTPLPRFWYLPRDAKAAVVMTGDDHGVGGTAGQFENFKAARPANCSVADWQCVRSTSYVYPGTSVDDAQEYQAEGFEIALHLSTACADFTEASLEEDWVTQLEEFASAFQPSLAVPQTNRTHCITWSDWAGEPKAEFRHGVRLDANYYYWPEEWVNDRPGMFTGSGFPMRFADLDGTLIDVYQAATQLTDESHIDIPRHIRELLDGALGSNGYYGVFTANMHTDEADHPGANAIVAEAVARGVPVVSAKQMLTWLDGRNGSSFQGLSFAGGELHFTVAAAPGSNGLRAMVPVSAATGQLVKLTRNGAVANVTRRTVKGIDYAAFDAAAGGNYVASYGPVDSTPPETTIGDATVTDGGAQITFSSNETGWFECRLDGGAFGACASPAVYSGLADGSHTFSVRAIDTAGNVDPTPASRGFDTAGGTAGGGTTTGAGTTGAGTTTAGGGSTPGGGQTTGQGATSAVDRSGPRVTIVKRTVRASAKGLVTLRIACPRGEQRCRVDLRLRRGGRQLVGKSLTVPGGKAANVTLRLLRNDRLRLVRVRSLLVDAAATGRDVAGNRATTTTRIRILAPIRR